MVTSCLQKNICHNICLQISKVELRLDGKGTNIVCCFITGLHWYWQHCRSYYSFRAEQLGFGGKCFYCETFLVTAVLFAHWNETKITFQNVSWSLARLPLLFLSPDIDKLNQYRQVICLFLRKTRPKVLEFHPTVVWSLRLTCLPELLQMRSC